MATLARLAKMSVSKLKYCFKEVTGCSVSEYTSALRMSQAKQLLQTTDLPIGEIAEMTGYKHGRSFTSAFRRAAGVSPREYRKRFQ